MLDHAAQFAAAGIPFLFDPGQGLPMFNGEELVRLLVGRAWVAVNDYEASSLSERTGWSAEHMATRVKAHDRHARRCGLMDLCRRSAS